MDFEHSRLVMRGPPVNNLSGFLHCNNMLGSDMVNGPYVK
jgi:hypothetical protein